MLRVTNKHLQHAMRQVRNAARRFDPCNLRTAIADRLSLQARCKVVPGFRRGYSRVGREYQDKLTTAAESVGHASRNLPLCVFVTPDATPTSDRIRHLLNYHFMNKQGYY